MLLAADIFLKLDHVEGELVNGQSAFVQNETKLIANSGGTMAAAEIAYLNTLDADAIRVDSDLVGTPASPTGAAGGINGILAPLAGSGKAGHQLASESAAIEQDLKATEAAQAQLQSIMPSATAPFTAKNAWPTSIEWGISFAEIEDQLIAADPQHLGPALGTQGSASPGPVGGLLQDIAVLSADSAPPAAGAGTAAGPGTALSAINNFLQIEDVIELKTNSLLGQYTRKKLPGRMKSGTIDLIRIENDLIGTPTTAGGINGVLLADAKQLQLPQGTIDEITQVSAAIGQSRDALVKLEQTAGSNPDQGRLNPSLAMTAVGLTLNYSQIENALVQAVPGLGPALGPQGSGAPGPAGGLLQDAFVLTADAGNLPPQSARALAIGAGSGDASDIVDMYLTITRDTVAAQDAVVRSELKYVGLGVQLPASIVNYFQHVDEALLQMDEGMIGVDGILLNLPGLHQREVAQLKQLSTELETGEQAVMAAEKAIGNTSGPITARAESILAGFPALRDKFERAFGAIALNFDLIEEQLIGLDPTQAAIQDSKNIADGAAKGQAQE